MTHDDAGFVAAVRDNPADDTYRLVYADWLDDRNDPRGRLLRAEVAFAAAVVGALPALAAADRPPLHLGFTVLAMPPADRLPEPFVTFARGLMIGATYDRAGTLRALADLPQTVSWAVWDTTVEAGLWKAMEFVRVGGTVAGVVEGDAATAGVWGARRAVADAAAAALDAGRVVEQAWWRAVRPHLRLTLVGLAADPLRAARGPARPRPSDLWMVLYRRHLRVPRTPAEAPRDIPGTLPRRLRSVYAAEEAVRLAKDFAPFGGRLVGEIAGDGETPGE